MEIHKECIETNAVKFLSWTMVVLSNMGTAAKQQFFYLSLLLEGMDSLFGQKRERELAEDCPARPTTDRS